MDAAPSFRPPWALMCWVTDEAIFIEIPMSPVPYIQKFALTDGGLHKALNALREIHREAPGRWAAPKSQPMVKKIVRGKVKPEPTQEQLNIAYQILKKHGVI